MGIKRIVDTSFWTDGKVDDFSPEDKYFMLYLLTNPFSTQLGIYEISIKQAAFQMGYSVDAVKVLIDRFENKYGVVIFSPATNEIAIKNFLRHSIIKGGAPVRDCLIKEIKNVKNKDLIAQVFLHIKNSETLNGTVKKIIAEYEEKNGVLNYSNEKQNDNDNDNDNENEVSYHDTPNDTLNESFSESSKIIDYQQIVDLFNSACVSFSPVCFLSDAMKEDIKASLTKYAVDDFKQCFKNAEASSFLKGDNKGEWAATFDWLIKADNMAKVLNGNYANKPQNNNKSYDLDEFFEVAVARSWKDLKENPPKTAGEDEEIRKRAEALKEKLK